MSSVWWDRRDLMRSKRRVNETKARWACLGRSPWVAALRRRFPMTRATGVRLPDGLGGCPMVRDIGSWRCHGGFSLGSVSLSGCLGRWGRHGPVPGCDWRCEWTVGGIAYATHVNVEPSLVRRFSGVCGPGRLRSGVLAERAIDQGPSGGVGGLYLRVADAAWPWPYLPRTTLVLSLLHNGESDREQLRPCAQLGCASLTCFMPCCISLCWSRCQADHLDVTGDVLRAVGDHARLGQLVPLTRSAEIFLLGSKMVGCRRSSRDLCRSGGPTACRAVAGAMLHDPFAVAARGCGGGAVAGVGWKTTLERLRRWVEGAIYVFLNF